MRSARSGCAEEISARPEDAFRQAHELGHEPQPGLALLRLAEKNVEAAAGSIKRALADQSMHPLIRARRLPAQVEIALAAGDLDSARSATVELEGITKTYRAPALQANAVCAQGALELAEGNASAACRSLREGLRLWQEVDAPYEAAWARMMLATACRADGDDETAALELRAAHAAFERLGAVPDARRAAHLLGSDTTAAGAQARVPSETLRTFMFTDIVKSTTLLEAIGDEAWADLLRWHDSTLRSLFTQHGGEEIDHAGDGFFVAFKTAPSAIECAVAIQRALADHRRLHGFSPQVRIGLHAAKATYRDFHYRGKGVHQAARIAALAEAGEVVASQETLAADLARFAVSKPQRDAEGDLRSGSGRYHRLALVRERARARLVPTEEVPLTWYGYNDRARMLCERCQKKSHANYHCQGGKPREWHFSKLNTQGRLRSWA